MNESPVEKAAEMALAVAEREARKRRQEEFARRQKEDEDAKVEREAARARWTAEDAELRLEAERLWAQPRTAASRARATAHAALVAEVTERRAHEMARWAAEDEAREARMDVEDARREAELARWLPTLLPGGQP